MGIVFQGWDFALRNRHAWCEEKEAAFLETKEETIQRTASALRQGLTPPPQINTYYTTPELAFSLDEPRTWVMASRVEAVGGNWEINVFFFGLVEHLPQGDFTPIDLLHGKKVYCEKFSTRVEGGVFVIEPAGQTREVELVRLFISYARHDRSEARALAQQFVKRFSAAGLRVFIDQPTGTIVAANEVSMLTYSGAIAEHVFRSRFDRSRKNGVMVLDACRNNDAENPSVSDCVNTCRDKDRTTCEPEIAAVEFKYAMPRDESEATFGRSNRCFRATISPASSLIENSNMITKNNHVELRL